MRRFFFIYSFSLILILSACQNQAAAVQVSSELTPLAGITLPTSTPFIPAASPTPSLPQVAISPSVPTELRQKVAEGLPADWQSDLVSADYVFSPLPVGDDPDAAVDWVYALAAPFDTVTDEVSTEELQALWRSGLATSQEFATLLVSAETEAVFESVWGSPAPAVQVMSAGDLLEAAWDNQTTLAILPFTELTPRWKVLRVAGVSPYDQDFSAGGYALTVLFGWLNQKGLAVGSVPAVDSSWTNRDPDQFTSLILTGTTALVRYTAQRMEELGVNYPAEQIGAVLRSADITHISNEVSFDPDCPAADPVRTEMRFCSDPSYYELLETSGVDVVELTGNHTIDWGVEPFEYTLALYNQHELPYYGGGANLEEALRPLKIENNGNKLAFLGCNRSGPENVWATAESAGAAPCDLEAMEIQIKQLVSEGYLPIVTFQHYEVDDFMPMNITRQEFERISAAGAVIVSGSQAHFPHGFAFSGDNFIHFGLGNLYFDQMFTYNRREFIDRHIFYAGQYLGVELITAELEDYAQPRLMDAEERAEMLSEYFEVSGW